MVSRTVCTLPAKAIQPVAESAGQRYVCSLLKTRWWRFGEDGRDLIRVDSEFKESLVVSFVA